MVDNCNNCGACCMGQNTLPLQELPMGGYVSLWVLQQAEKLLGGPLVGDDGCPCIWLDRLTGRCIHHEYRPGDCRDFEIGGEACLRIRAEVEL